MDIQEELFSFLQEHDIPYRLLVHDPVKNMEDCAAVAAPLGAVYPKNLFLSPRSGRPLCLLIQRPFLRYSASVVSAQAGLPRLQFAPDGELLRCLHARPGSASPLALCLPEAGDVRLLVDSALKQMPLLCFHPMDSSRTVVLSGDDFFCKFLPETGHSPAFITL